MCAFICLVLIGCRQAPRYEKELERLDEALARNEEWVTRKEHAIAQLREKLARAVQDEERYWINKDLYREYLEFDADSAGYYVEQNIDLAARMGKPEDVQRWHIERAMVLIQTGQLNEAEHVLRSIDKKALPKRILPYYYARTMSLNHAYSIYIEDMGTEERSRYFNRALVYRDSVLLYMDPNDPQFLNIKAWDSFDAHDYADIKQLLRERVDHSPLNTSEDAISAYNLSAMCREDGEQEDYIYYLVRSSIAYVQSGSRNYASESIQELSEVLLLRGDLSRAYTYIHTQAVSGTRAAARGAHQRFAVGYQCAADRIVGGFLLHLPAGAEAAAEGKAIERGQCRLAGKPCGEGAIARRAAAHERGAAAVQPRASHAERAAQPDQCLVAAGQCGEGGVHRLRLLHMCGLYE